MTKIDIFSGFLGAGKTTLIKKLIKESFQGEKIVLIENEFGEIGIDGGFMKDSGVQVNEMNSGCICCSLVGDFGKALSDVLHTYSPDRIIIEPSGVGKLSDVINAVKTADTQGAVLNSAVAVVDAGKCKMYMKNFGEFYNNQIENATAIIFSRSQNLTGDKLKAAVELIRGKNAQAIVVTTDWTQLTGEVILNAIEHKKDMLKELVEEHHDHAHHESCGCGNHHDHEHHEGCGCGNHQHHEHHEHHEGCGCGNHHDHEHHEGCGCGHHHGEHEHHHHHADEVFDNWGTETTDSFTIEEIENILAKFDSGELGVILRAKGIVKGEDSWIHFDYVPGEANVRKGSAEVTGKICVIGAQLSKDEIKMLWRKA